MERIFPKLESQAGGEEMEQPPQSIEISEISVIIPVKNNQRGINLFIREFVNHHKPAFYPKEILIVDDHSSSPIYTPLLAEQANLPCRVIPNEGLGGPASARNFGAKQAQGQWFLFTDSDCVPSSSFLTGYLSAIDGSVAYEGNKKALQNNPLSRYYESESHLLAVAIKEGDDIFRPQYLVTANALVWREAFEKIQGFDEENFRLAGGEDVELSMRLATLGKLAYAIESVIYHDYSDGLKGFIKRHYRYGKSFKALELKYNLDFSPQYYPPAEDNLFYAAMTKLQYFMNRLGYNSVGVPNES